MNWLYSSPAEKADSFFQRGHAVVSQDNMIFRVERASPYPSSFLSSELGSDSPSTQEIGRRQELLCFRKLRLAALLPPIPRSFFAFLARIHNTGMVESGSLDVPPCTPQKGDE